MKCAAVVLISADGCAEILVAYLRSAACLETPSIAPISDQERSALRASRMASSNATSTSSRCSTDSAMVRDNPGCEAHRRSSSVGIELGRHLHDVARGGEVDCDHVREEFPIGDTAFDPATQGLGVVCLPCDDTPVVAVPAGVVSIISTAFDGCPGLTSVVLPSTLRTLALEAFGQNPHLVNFVIPDSVRVPGYKKVSQGFAYSECPDSVLAPGALLCVRACCSRPTSLKL